MVDSDLQLSWLVSFTAVVEHGSFTAAARSIVRSQPRVSAHVAQLERALGAQLLVRTRRGAHLTVAGERFLPYAEAVLRDLRGGSDVVAALSNQLQGKVSIGSYPGASAILVAPLMQQFRRRYPAVQLELHESVDPVELEAAVDRGDADFAIRTAEAPRQRRGLPSEFLCHERIVLMTPPGSPIAAAGDVDLRKLKHETIVLTGDPRAEWADFRDRLDRIGINPRQQRVFTLATTVVALVRAGMGVGLLGAFAAHATEAPDDVQITPLPLPTWQREIRVFRRDEPAADAPAVAAFVRMMHREGPRLTGARAVWGLGGSRDE